MPRDMPRIAGTHAPGRACDPGERHGIGCVGASWPDTPGCAGDAPNHAGTRLLTADHLHSTRG